MLQLLLDHITVHYTRSCRQLLPTGVASSVRLSVT